MTEGGSDGKGGSGGGKFDWLSPLKERVELVYIVFIDAVVVFSIAIIANGLEFGLTKLTQHTINWTIRGVTLSLADIMHYGDLFIFVVFLVVSLWHVLKWATKR